MSINTNDMKREIKFRAWTGKEILCDVIPVNDFAVITDMQGFPPTANVLYRHDIESIMQFTGLHDKNGKEIYEGDILKVGENLTCEIIYVENNVDDYGDEINAAFHAKVYKQNKIIPLDGYLKLHNEIIGNIYENKELLTNN